MTTECYQTSLMVSELFLLDIDAANYTHTREPRDFLGNPVNVFRASLAGSPKSRKTFWG